MLYRKKELNKHGDCLLPLQAQAGMVGGGGMF